MSSIISSAVGTIVATHLPFDQSTNIALGMATNQIVQYTLDQFGNATDWVWSHIGWSRKLIRICVSEKGKLNPIHKKLEEYILDKYIEKLSVCNLVPLKGDIVIDLRDGFFKIPLEITYTTGASASQQSSCLTNIKHKMYLTFSSETKSVAEEDVVRKAKTILVYSYSASMDDIKSFISGIVKLVKPPSNIMTVYRVILPNKIGMPHWDYLRFKSNKTEKNTIVSKQVEKELFDDIDLFMKSDELYSQRGMDYKRGYLLFGEPGCGKSSSIKAIANKYNLFVFNLDLESIKTNSHLLSLMNDMLDEVPDTPYILTLEDFDRHEMFTDPKTYNARKDKVTLQCLLNVIDGIVETHGRILFITCNDKTNIEKIDALIRPGRIDRVVTLTHCDADQASRLINNYFKLEGPDTISIEASNIVNLITPADLIKKMQTSQSIAETLIYICKNPSDINSICVDTTLKQKEEKLKQLSIAFKDLSKQVNDLNSDITLIKSKNNVKGSRQVSAGNAKKRGRATKQVKLGSKSMNQTKKTKIDIN